MAHAACHRGQLLATDPWSVTAAIAALVAAGVGIGALIVSAFELWFTRLQLAENADRVRSRRKSR